MTIVKGNVDVKSSDQNYTSNSQWYPLNLNLFMDDGNILLNKILL